MQNHSEQQLLHSLSLLISKKRKDANLSEEQLAELAQISVHRIKSLEEGKERLGLELLSKLAHAFHTTVIDLISEAEDFN